MKPTFIGIGAQKCASTWLYSVLKDHPQVRISDPKELDFFSSHYWRGFQWYENFFKNAPSAIAAGEISTSYFYDLDAPRRAWHYNPEFKIIVTLRDPVERAYSNHLHEVSKGRFKGEDLSFERGLINNPMYLEQSRYALHLQRWLEAFPANQLRVFFQEEIKADPVQQACLLYSFLQINLGHSSKYLNRRVNSSRLSSPVKLASWWDKINFLKRLVPETQPPHTIKIRLSKNKPFYKKTCYVPTMPESTRLALQKELAEEMKRLTVLLNRDSLPWEIRSTRQ